MNKFVPNFYVINRQRQFLTRNDKTGTNQLKVKWTIKQDDAPVYGWYIDAVKLRNDLPESVRGNTIIIDQLGDTWTVERAQQAGVYEVEQQQVAA